MARQFVQQDATFGAGQRIACQFFFRHAVRFHGGRRRMPGCGGCIGVKVRRHIAQREAIGLAQRDHGA